MLFILCILFSLDFCMIYVVLAFRVSSRVQYHQKFSVFVRVFLYCIQVLQCSLLNSVVLSNYNTGVIIVD